MTYTLYDLQTQIDDITASGVGGGSGDVTQEELTTTSGDIVDQIPSLTGYATQTYVSDNYIDNNEMTTISGNLVSQMGGGVTESQLTTTSGDIIDQLPTITGTGGIVVSQDGNEWQITSSGCPCDASEVSFIVYLDPDGSLNTSTDDAVPTMTSNTAPSPLVAAATSEHNSNVEAYCVFDDLVGDSGYNYWGATSIPAAVSIDFGLGNEVIINKMRWRARNYSGRHGPRDWQIDASNVVSPTLSTDDDWTTLFSIEDQEDPGQAAWTDYYTWFNSTAYRYYRMKITDRNVVGSTTVYLSVAEIEYISAIVVIPRVLPTESGTSVYDALIELDSYAIKQITGQDGIEVSTTESGVVTISQDLYASDIYFEPPDGSDNDSTDYATPAMTSNTSPAPCVVSSDSIHNSSYDCWKAFDQVVTGRGWISARDSTHWIKFYFGATESGKIINKYRWLAPDSYEENCPAEWELQGSFDDATWVTLDSRSRDGNPGASTWTEWYTFSNSESYPYYRMYITAADDGGDRVEFAELQLVETTSIQSLYSAFNFVGTNGISVTTTRSGTEISQTISSDQIYYEPADGSRNESTDYATPAMTSNTSPSPYVVSASYEYSSYYAWKAFNQTVIDGTDMWYARTTLPHWLKIYMGENNSKKINKYRFRTRNDGTYEAYTPRDWKLSGSNDDSSWVVLDERSGVSAPSRAEWTEWFTFNNLENYLYYKLDITANQSHNFTMLGELQLVEGTVGTVYDLLNELPFDPSCTSDGARNKSTDYATPVMTSNTTPAPYEVSADSTYSTRYPYYLFDQTTGSNYWTSAATAPPHWVQFYFGATESGKVINKYRLLPYNYDDRFPATWKLQASISGTEWVDLDSRQSITYPGDYTWTEWYTFKNAMAYPYYRLYVEANNGSATYTEFDLIQFVALEDCDEIYDFTYLDSDSNTVTDALYDLDQQLVIVTGSGTWSGTGGAEINHNLFTMDHFTTITPLDSNPGSWWLIKGQNTDMLYSDTLSGTGSFDWMTRRI